MKYTYGEFNGDEFPTSDDLFGLDQLMNFILQYGDQALDAIRQMMKDGDNPEMSEMLQQMLDEGMLKGDGKGKISLTPKAITRMQQKALLELFANLKRGQREGHQKTTPGVNGERIEGSKPYEFGDPVSELDLHATMHNAIQRSGIASRDPDARKTGSHIRNAGSGTRIPIGERDFELHLHEGVTSCSTVVLLDMSGSMMRYGRYLAAKKVAMAMQGLVRSKFPQDTIDFVGFYSGAKQIPEAALPLTMPKPVTVYDYQVRLKVPVNQLDKAPQHFTNLHMGLQLSRRILKRRGSENKQIFIITDGQPTAHVEGDFVHLLYPPDERSTIATLKEAVMLARDDVRIASFALIEDYWGMEWVSFIDQMTRLTKGTAFYTTSGELASCVMESYLSGRKKKTFLG